MTAGHVNRTTLSSNYQSVGDVYSDTKTEGAFEVIAQQVDDNYDAAVAINSSLTTHKTATTLDHPDGSVKTPKIADLAVTQEKIANGAVGPNQLQTGLAATVDVNAQFAKRGIDVTSSPYNAKGDGVTDDTAAIQAAIDAASAAGGGIVWLPPGRYMITGTNVLTLYSNVSLKGIKGASILDFSNRGASVYKYFIGASGSIASGISLSSDVDVNSNVIQMNTSGLAEGDLIIISSNYTWYDPSSNTKHGEYMIVDEILSASKVRMKSATHESYTVANAAKIYKVTPVENITIEGITFQGRGRLGDGNQSGDYGIGITYGNNISVKDCQFYDIDEVQLEFRSCYNFEAVRNYHSHTKYYSPSGTVGEAKPTALATRGTVQYQIRTADCCQYGVIRDCVGEGGRHMFNTGHSSIDMDGSVNPTSQLFGINRYITVEKCYSKNTWHAGFSTHNDAEFVSFIHCKSENSGMAGYNPRSKNIKIINCDTINAERHTYLTGSPENIEIIGGKAVRCKTLVYLNGDDMETTFAPNNITIRGMEVDGSESCIFITHTNYSGSEISNLNISDNIIKNTVNTGNYSPIRVRGKFKCNISNNKINNTSIGYAIRLEGVVNAIVNANVVKQSYRLFLADATSLKVIVANNVFQGYSFSTIDNNATTPTNQNNVIL